MALSKAAQAAILASDSERRRKREAIEDALLTDMSTDRYKIAHAPKDSHVNACLVRGIGVVSPPPKPSASPNCWDRGMRGKTVGSADPNVKTPTVKITSADGTSRIVPVSEVRGIERKRATKQHTATTRKPETARLNTHHDFTTH
jgi:hypothetical protein